MKAKQQQVDELELQAISPSDIDMFLTPENRNVGKHLKKLANKTNTLIKELQRREENRYRRKQKQMLHGSNEQTEEKKNLDIRDSEQSNGQKNDGEGLEEVQEEVKPEEHAETNAPDEEMIEGIKQHQSGT